MKIVLNPLKVCTCLDSKASKGPNNLLLLPAYFKRNVTTVGRGVVVGGDKDPRTVVATVSRREKNNQMGDHLPLCPPVPPLSVCTCVQNEHKVLAFINWTR